MISTNLFSCCGSSTPAGPVDLTENLVAHYLLNNNADDCVGTFDGSMSGAVNFTGDYLDPLSESITIPDSSTASCSYWKDTGSGFNFVYTTTIPSSLTTDSYSNLRMYSDTKNSTFQSGLEAEGYYPKPLPLPTTDGLIAHYPLTGTAEDLTGNYDGVENGVTYVDDLEFGSVADMNTNDAYIDLDNTFDLRTSSYSTWVNMSDTSSNSCLFGTISGITYAEGYVIAVGADKFGIIGSNNGSDWTTLVRCDFTNTLEWKHLVCTIDDETIIKLYIDGVIQSKVNGTTNGFSVGTENSQIGFTDRELLGKIKDARIYNKALTQQEITDIYNYEKNFRNVDIDDGLVAYYPLKSNSDDNYFNEYNAPVTSGVTFNGVEAIIPDGDSISFPAVTNFVIAYYIKDGIHLTTTTEADLNDLTDCTLREVRKYNKTLTTEQEEIIGW